MRPGKSWPGMRWPPAASLGSRTLRRSPAASGRAPGRPPPGTRHDSGSPPILAADWPALHVVDVNQTVAVRPEMAEALALRARDAVQLAAADAARNALAEPVTFASFDRRLNRAARLLGLDLPAWSVT